MFWWHVERIWKKHKANPEKCNLFVSKKKTSLTVTSDNFNIDINGVKIRSSLEQKFIMVVSIEDQLVFKGHIYNMLKKASQNLMHLQELIPTWSKRKRQ